MPPQSPSEHEWETPGYKYTIAMSALAKLGSMSKNLDERGRYDAVMAADDLFKVEPVQ